MEIIRNIDSKILFFINKNMSSNILNDIMIFITNLGDNGFIWLLITAILLIRKKTRSTGIRIAIALILSVLAGNLILKNLFERSRPFFIFPHINILIEEPSGFSFPSAHSMSSFAAATVIFLSNKKFGILALILALLIAFSRLYLFVHFPSDVIIGSTIGILLGIISSNLKLKNK